MKKIRKALTAVIVLSMMASYVYVPVVNAASLTNVSDTMSTSAPSTLANHDFGFTTNVVLDTNGYIEVEFQNAGFGEILDTADITCPSAGTKATTTPRTARCTYGSGLATSTFELLINNITNPTAGFYDIEIRTYNSGNTLLESSIIKVAIIDTVTVTAHVDSTLTFYISGTASSTSINGVTTTQQSSTTTLPFGDLEPGVPTIVGQQLQVTTNASAGFQVTVTQNDDFKTAAGAKIDSFVDGSATTTPTTWASPTGDLALPTTWGHLGITTDDNDGLGGLSTTYGSNEFTGLSVGTSTLIMAHNGPSSGSATNKGQTNVAYAVEINALQEAGDYETTVTYIATPTF